MIFLNPAVLFGLLAASIPVLIHLLNLKKLKKIDFSTLSFLKELQKNKIRKLKLKQWLLLALRVLIILFVVTAFARPALKGLALGGTTSAAKTTAVFILDNTFSMSAVDANGSYFNQAKQTILDLIKNLQQGDEAALVLMADQGNDVIKPTLNISEFIKQVKNADISYSSGTVNHALIRAAEILDKSNNFNKEIYLLSDFQQGRLIEGKSFPDLSRLLNDKIKLYTFNYSGKDIYNLGIDDLKLNTQIFEKGKPVSFNTVVTNYSAQPADNTVVSLFIGGERSAQQSISLSPGESRIITMQASAKSTGYIDAVAELEDDDIIYDDKRYANFYIPDQIPVAIFYDNENDIKFIETALGLTESGSIKLTVKNLNQISSLDLSQFDAVVIVGSKGISNIESLKSYVENGGGLFLMPGEQTDLTDFTNLTLKTGLPSPEGTAGKINETVNALSFDKIEFDHPIFKNIFSDGEKKKIQSPDIYFHYKISTLGRGINIISLTDGTSFLSDYKIGKGKTLLLNISPVLSWSNFPLKNIFAPLLLKSVFYLASKDIPENDYFAGKPVTVNLPGVALPQVKAMRPDDTGEFINLERSGSANFVVYGRTNTAGNYKFYSGEKRVAEISVNTDPAESVTKYISISDFRKYLDEIHFMGKFISISKDENPSEVVMRSRFGSELWRLFLFAALITGLVEMAVSRSAKKDLVQMEP
jgi:uncharacterized membrane protein